jgi:hypothetical protein
MVFRTEASLTVIYDGWSVARLTVSADVRAVKSGHWKERKRRKGKKVWKDECCSRSLTGF